MNKIFAIIMLALLLSGCTSVSLNSKETSEDKIATISNISDNNYETPSMVRNDVSKETQVEDFPDVI